MIVLQFSVNILVWATKVAIIFLLSKFLSAFPVKKAGLGGLGTEIDTISARIVAPTGYDKLSCPAAPE